MIKRTSKKILSLSLIIIFASGCVPFFSKNRFVRNSVRNSFSFGFAGYDDYQYCKKLNPNFIKKYSNGVNPTRRCIHYQYYTCHVSHYCKGDSQCEADAAQYWSGSYYANKDGSLVTDLQERVEITKRGCETEARQCNSAKPNDQSCRGYKKPDSQNNSKK